MATEILYCARCRRVILPREIAEGHYHFVDGDSVCTECFTRLSRRLRAQPPADPQEQPQPVDISDIPPTPVPPSLPVVPVPPRPPMSRRRPAERSRAHLIVPVIFLIIGLLIGGYAYLAARSGGQAPPKRPAGETPAATTPVPAPAPDNKVSTP